MMSIFFANYSDKSILDRFTSLGFKCIDSKIKSKISILLFSFAI
jgi:hypothetical protein